MLHTKLGWENGLVVDCLLCVSHYIIYVMRCSNFTAFTFLVDPQILPESIHQIQFAQNILNKPVARPTHVGAARHGAIFRNGSIQKINVFEKCNSCFGCSPSSITITK